MKLQWNKKYAMFALYAFLIIFCIVLCVFFFLDFDRFGKLFLDVLSVFNPILYGIFIAYLISPILHFLEETAFVRLDGKGKYRLKRTLCVVITVLGLLLFLALLVWRMLPNILRGYADLQEMSGFYLKTVKEWLLGLSAKGEGLLSGYLENITVYAVDLLEKLYAAIFSIVPDVASVAGAIVGIAKDLFFGLILSIYFLFAKEKLLAEGKKVFYALLPENKYRTFSGALALADRKFGGFFKGQLADALIIGTLCFAAMAIIGLPYYPLVSMLVGLSAIIPVFGTVIGTVIGSLIILLADPYQVIWFVILMLCLYVFNKKLLYPHLLRDGRGASSIFMFAALVIMTGLLGFKGLVLGVPVFTTLYSFFALYINRKLRQKGLPTDDLSYYSTDVGRELYKEELSRARGLTENLAGEAALLEGAPEAKELPEQSASPDAAPSDDVPESEGDPDKEAVIGSSQRK